MLRTLKHYLTLDLIRCLVSAGLLILAFPKTDLWILAWGGLVPLLFTLDGKVPWVAFRWAYLCGFLFFAGTLFWFFHITQWFSFIAAIGIILLFSYLALYFGLFGLFVSLFSRQKPLFKLLFIPSVWVVLEFIRGHLFTGFDWASLGYSQYKNLLMIQIADVTGVFGVSFAIVMVNFMIKELIAVCLLKKTAQSQKTLSIIIGITVVIIISILSYGKWRLTALEQKQTDEKLVAAVIQANIPQEKKWDKLAWTDIMDQYIDLTKKAAKEKPDLIIWPETSYPGYLWDDDEHFIELQSEVRRIRTPLLIGAVTHEDEDYFNSALLLSKKGDVVETYRKVHLVPFGEYLPLRSIFPFLSGLVTIGDFSAGNQWTLFSSDERVKENQYSVLICFEDTVARLSRQFVRRGAQFLVNMTNDAWFGNSKAPFMHLQSSVFRTIENRRAMVRAANTGVSCFIDQLGRVTKCVGDDGKHPSERTYVRGYALGEVTPNSQKTFYTKFGDIFTILCFGCILLGIIKKGKVKTC